MTPEGKVKKIIKDGLHEIYIFPFEKALACVKNNEPIAGYYLMPGSSGIGEAGIGDFLICMRGEFIEIETKTTKGKPTGIQKAHASVISAAGGKAYLVSGEDEANHFIEFISRELKAMIEMDNIADHAREVIEGQINKLQDEPSKGKMH